MNLQDLVNRKTPAPWSEGDNIPWNEPGFSSRMLKEHLSQEHDAASRRAITIDRHVSYIHRKVLGGKAARVLDLGCGPGLYLQRLARLGHTCRGIDFSPASIEYARQQAGREGVSIQYELSDLRKANFGSGFDLGMLIYGEFNVFSPEAGRSILERAYAALAPGGRFVMEPSPVEHIRAIGAQPPRWYTATSGLFSDRPHLVLEESFWDEKARAATVRFFLVDAATGEATRYAASYQSYSDDEYRGLFEACGFEDIEFLPNLTGEGQRAKDFIAIKARKQV